MRQIKADLLPVIFQKWGQEDEDKKTYYTNPLPSDVGNGLRIKQSSFKDIIP